MSGMPDLVNNNVKTSHTKDGIEGDTVTSPMSASVTRMRKAMVLLAVAVLLSLSACASATPVPRASQPLWGMAVPANAPLSNAQRSDLADGKITNDEYHESFRRFAACLAKGGFTVMDNGTKNDIIQFGVPAAAGALDDKCYTQEFQWVDGVWQSSRADTSNQAKAYGECLTEKGITPKKTEDEKYQQLQEANIDASECYGRLYPHG
jgi:hypothetical protein